MKNPTSKTLLLIAFLFLATCFTESMMQAQSETEPIVSHYVFPKFVKGSVKMKNGSSQIAMMDYNMLTEEMIFEKDENKFALDKLETIDTIYIENRKFVPHEKVLYEIVINAPVSLFVQHKCNLLAGGSPVGYGGTSETSATTSMSSINGSGGALKLKLPSDYHITKATQFWIRRNNIFYKANNDRQFMKIFPEKSKELKQFIELNNLDIKNTNELIILVNKCNELGR